MKFIVRKISIQKWDPLPDLEDDNIQADAITVDLKTTGNELSVWECESEENLEQVALALASAGTRLNVVDVTWVETSSLPALGIQSQKTLGDTPVSDLRGYHLNIMNLDLRRITALAQLFTQKIRQEQKRKRFSKPEVKKLITEAVKAERLNLDDLKDDLKKQIQEAIQSELHN